MNQMPTTIPERLSKVSLPPPADDKTAELIRAVRSIVGVADGRPVFLNGKSIGPNTRRALTDRLRVLNDAFGVRSRKELERALAKMFSVMKISHDDVGNAAEILRDYADVLMTLPVWAVYEACELVKRGRGPSATWAPTSAELFKMAEEVAKPFHLQRAELSRFLAAKPYEDAASVPEEERKRVAEGFDKLSAELALSSAKRAREDREMGVMVGGVRP